MRDKQSILLGKLIQEYRKKAGLSASELALFSKISISMIRKIERGERQPSLNVFIKLCYGLNLHPPTILTEYLLILLDE